jgi:hypothetical protein
MTITQVPSVANELPVMEPLPRLIVASEEPQEHTMQPEPVPTDCIAKHFLQCFRDHTAANSNSNHATDSIADHVKVHSEIWQTWYSIMKHVNSFNTANCYAIQP